MDVLKSIVFEIFARVRPTRMLQTNNLEALMSYDEE